MPANNGSGLRAYLFGPNDLGNGNEKLHIVFVEIMMSTPIAHAAKTAGRTRERIGAAPCGSLRGIANWWRRNYPRSNGSLANW